MRIFKEKFPVLRIIVRDKKIEQQIREHSYRYLVDYAMRIANKDGKIDLLSFYNQVNVKMGFQGIE